MFLRRSTAALAMLSFGLTSTSALAAQCWEPAEMNSVRLHSLNMMLFVGSLKCRDVTPVVRENYSAFAQAKHEMLAGNAFLVSAHFINRHGLSSGKIAFANYESMVANQYSGRTDDAVSCARIGAYARLATNASESDLLELASAVTVLPSVSCPAAPTIIAAPPAAAIAAADKPSQDHAAQVISANLTTTAGAANEPVVKPAIEAAAPAVVAVAAPAKPVPAPSAADALAEAARALALAAAAMQAQAATPAAAAVTMPPAVAMEKPAAIASAAP